MPDAEPTPPTRSSFDAWFAEAGASEPNDPNAMTLATARRTARPPRASCC